MLGMTNDIITFEYGDYSIRTVLLGGELWFVAVDVCLVLGLPYVSKAVQALDDDEKRQVSIPARSTIQGSSEQRRTLSAVNEPGLYSLILRSRRPGAERFKRWITHVLPALRSKGTDWSSWLRSLLDEDLLILRDKAGEVLAERAVKE